MEGGARDRHYLLLPFTQTDSPAGDDGLRMRRFRLGRVALTPRSELGADWHERLERVVELDRDRRRRD